MVGKKEVLQQVFSPKAGIWIQRGSEVKEGEFVHKQDGSAFQSLENKPNVLK